MHWITVITIGMAANLDNLGIGVSFGARSTKIPWISNLIIAILSMISTFASIAVGNVLSLYIPMNWANWGGGLLIVLVGLWSLKADFTSRSAVPLKEDDSLLNNPSKADKDGNNIISWKESLALGAALAVNCIAGGFGAGVSGLSPVAAMLSVGIFSLITIELGARVGYRFSQSWFGKYSNAIGGLLLVLIGFYEIFV